MEMRRRGSLFSAIAWHTVLCLFLMMVASYMALMVTGFGGGTGPTTVTTTITPSSKAYQSISLVQKIASSPAAMKVTLNLNDGTTRDLEIPGIGVNIAVLRDPAGNEVARAPFDETTVPKFFKLASIDIADQTVAAEAADLTRIIDKGIAASWSPPSTARVTKLTIGPPTYAGGTGPAATSDLLAQLLAVAIPLLLWVFGIIYIIFRRKKLLREAESADKPVPA